MITLKSGKKIQFLLSSGMMGFNGDGPTKFHKIIYYFLEGFGLFQPNLFSIVLKTISLEKISGPRKIRPIDHGWWNNYGLGNPGLYSFLDRYAAKIKEKNNLIISIFVRNTEQLKVFIENISFHFPNILAVELNISCSNFKEEKFDDPNFVEELVSFWNYMAPTIPLILKVGEQNDCIRIAKITEGMIDALDINSIARDSGAHSGEVAQITNWQILKSMAENTSTPIIGPSVWHYRDIEKLFDLGAKAISFGSISMIHPKRPWGPILPNLYVRKFIRGE
ncbi:hypothetical protein KKD04_02990 [Patescibacteria group bacterium]|nr:hypothetical protein [Patescibacteria group bacterium]